MGRHSRPADTSSIQIRKVSPQTLKHQARQQITGGFSGDHGQKWMRRSLHDSLAL